MMSGRVGISALVPRRCEEPAVGGDQSREVKQGAESLLDGATPVGGELDEDTSPRPVRRVVAPGRREQSQTSLDLCITAPPPTSFSRTTTGQPGNGSEGTTVSSPYAPERMTYGGKDLVLL
jgi:hypothetical protein